MSFNSNCNRPLTKLATKIATTGILFLLLISACQEPPPAKVLEAKTTVPKVEKEPTKQTPIKVNPPVLDYEPHLWTEVISLDSTILLDLRYATANNFVKEQMYDCGRCFLRPKVARRIFRAHQILRKKGFGLKMFDCYRPKPIQQKLWDKVPNPNYVMHPSKGSMHNRGAAVDLTIVNADGDELYMGTEFDYFGEEGHHTYTKLPAPVLANRRLLKSTMEEVGLAAIRTEWWHYSYKQKAYKVSDWVWDCN